MGTAGAGSFGSLRTQIRDQVVDLIAGQDAAERGHDAAALVDLFRYLLGLQPASHAGEAGADLCPLSVVAVAVRAPGGAKDLGAGGCLALRRIAGAGQRREGQSREQQAEKYRRTSAWRHLRMVAPQPEYCAGAPLDGAFFLIFACGRVFCGGRLQPCRTKGVPLTPIRSRILAILAAALFSLAPWAQAEVTLPHMLSDHAVLQREMPIHIWGHADPGEPVTVSFDRQKQSATTDEVGRWSLYLRPEPAGGPYMLTVQGSNTITLSDILIGDVWFASGQSNMELPLKGFPNSAVLKNGAQEIAAATHPRIRLLHFRQAAPEYEQRDQDAAWTLCTPATATEFSAVAYFFGRDLQEKEHVPIGLIDSSWGGTPIAAWISLDGLSADATLMPEFAARVPMVEAQADVPAMAAEEKREDEAARKAGQPAPKHAWHPDPASWEPAALFNGMVAPATEFTIKGVIWYQGETDSSADRAPLYERAFKAMITDWRSRWHEGDFPFLFVQISSFTSTPAETWGIIREAQRRTLSLAGTAMTVTLDVGEADNVHPADKQTVGSRLALAARAVAYGEQLEYSGPLFRQAATEGGSLRVYFTHAEGLMARGGTLEGFEVAGGDKRFHPATARVDGTTVLASADGVAHPRYVRYAWANAPIQANLFNGAGLPASTFTSAEHIPPPCPEVCGQ